MARMRPLAISALALGLSGISPWFAAPATHAAQATAAGVTVDVIATNADGRPIRDLTTSDLVVRLDGRVQTVTGIRLAPPPPPAVSALPEPYATNTDDLGRTMAILIDGTRLRAANADPLRNGVSQITDALGPQDRAALVPIGTDTRPVDFTTSHDRLATAAAAITLEDGPPASARQDEDRVDAMLGAVIRAMALLGPEPGVKTLVLATNPFRVTSKLQRTIQSVGEAAATHRIALYLVAPGSSDVTPADGLHALAAGTGGAVLPDTWASAVTAERARITVTLAPNDDLEPGETVRAIVGTARPDVRLRFAPFASVEAVGPAALESLTEMLRQPRIFTDLPLRLGVYPILHTDRSSIRLFIVGETTDDERPLAWSEFALLTPDGRLVSQWSEDRDVVTQRPLISGAIAPEGLYRLRWAASELSGRRGTVDLDVDVRLESAGPFRLSGLMLGQMVSDTFVPTLQPPADTPVVEWCAEVYGAAVDGQSMTTRLDVVTSESGSPVLTTPGQVRTSPDPERRALLGQVDVTSLAAGDYQFRATLVIDGQDAGMVTRTFRKTR